MNTRPVLTFAVGAAATLGPAAYLLFFRNRCVNWDARADEVAAKLPGDELLADPGLVTTRAITVHAPAGAIWPWLAQLGSGRGGAYSYDRIENLLGLNMHSAEEVLPEYQDIKAGDELPLGEHSPAMRVEIADPPRALAVRSTGQNWAWIFALLPEGDSTRLISRNRIATKALSPVRKPNPTGSRTGPASVIVASGWAAGPGWRRTTPASVHRHQGRRPPGPLTARRPCWQLRETPGSSPRWPRSQPPARAG